METKTTSSRTAPKKLTDKQSQLITTICSLLGVIAVGIGLYFLVGRPMLRFVGDTARFRDWVDNSGVWGRLAFIGMMAAQIMVAFIPGEPMEIAAGYAFGAVEGTGLCMLGALIGGTAVFLMVRKFGAPLVHRLFPKEKLEGVRLLNEPKRLNLTAFILFLIPGTPKDVLTYCAGLTKMKLKVWLGITSLARFPSIISSTLGGDALGLKDYRLAVIVFAATAVVSICGILYYRAKARD